MMTGGKPQYHSRLMLTLLIYCYANATFSSGLGYSMSGWSIGHGLLVSFRPQRHKQDAIDGGPSPAMR
jgi:hypothetical protein